MLTKIMLVVASIGFGFLALKFYQHHQITLMMQHLESESFDEAAQHEHSEALKYAYRVLDLAGVSIFLTLFFFIVATLYFYFDVLRPINRITEAMLRIAAGERDVELKDIRRRDEVGFMNEALQSFKDSAMETLASSEELADSEIKYAVERKQYVDALLVEFDENIQGLIKNVITATNNSIHSTTERLYEITDTNAQQTEALSEATQASSQSTEAISSAANELLAVLKSITEQVSETEGAIVSAMDKTVHAGNSVRTLESTVLEIVDVLQIIRKVAGQINMLALNATIEAARAGEAGKGFAVVAAEVNNLAKEVGEATERISEHIDSIQHATEETVTIIAEVKDTTEHVKGVFDQINDSARQQTSTAQSIVKNIDAAYDATKKVSAISDTVTNTTVQTKDIVDHMRSVTGDIGQQSAMLEMHVGRFIKQVQGDFFIDVDGTEEDAVDLF